MSERFILLRVEDKKDDRMATKLGLSKQGYPNIAVYDANQEFIGRVIGFGGTESWFKQVKDAVAVGEKLATRKEAATKKPEEWISVAELLLTIPDRAKDALASLDNVPKKKRKSKKYKAAVTRIGAHAAWGEVETELAGLMSGVRTREVAKEKAPAAIEKLDAFLKDHEGAAPELDPAALARKGYYLMFLDRAKEAAEIAKRLLTEFATSEETKTLLRGLR